MIRPRHLLHPVRSATSLYRRIGFHIYLRLAGRKLRRIPRGRRDRCWCDAELLPFEWHPSYGLCPECGCYVNRRPPLNLKQLYSFDRYWHTMQKIQGNPTIEDRSQAYKSDGRLDYWLKLIERYGPPKGHVIEVGCSPGILLEELKALGYQCIGVEPDEKSAEWIRRNNAVEVRSGLFPDLELPPCDLFLAFDVLEHTPCPERFMKEAAHLLNTGGIALIQVPVERFDFDDPFKQRPDFFNDLEHLFLFTDRAITKLAALTQLETIELEDNPCLPGHVMCVFKKA